MELLAKTVSGFCKKLLSLSFFNGFLSFFKKTSKQTRNVKIFILYVTIFGKYTAAFQILTT